MRPELLAEERLPVEARRRRDRIVVHTERVATEPNDAVVVADEYALSHCDEAIEG